MNLTKTYPFAHLSVGNSFTVYQRFQHCRVAASEFARKHGFVFTCRVSDDGTSMIVHRCAPDQRLIDQRGARGRRRIVNTNADPTAIQFDTWLATFTSGQSYTMPLSYSHLYVTMQAWCEVHSLRTGHVVTCNVVNNELVLFCA